MRASLAALALAAAMLTGPALAAAPPRPPLPEVAIEIYRIAPGQHQAFLALIARFDEANLKAGLPARQLYVHQDGGDWDFIFIQPEHTPADKAKALGEALHEMGTPSDADFFFEVRKFIAEHSDTAALGPTTAADWLARASH